MGKASLASPSTVNPLKGGIHASFSSRYGRGGWPHGQEGQSFSGDQSIGADDLPGLIDPEAMATWCPPRGMRMRIHAFEPRVGGTFRMSLEYTEAGHQSRGKTSEHADVVQGHFAELVPDERVVEVVEFESDDAAYAGAMTITTTLKAVAGGTEVTIVCEDVPSGISASDHQQGLASTLDNLASYAE